MTTANQPPVRPTAPPPDHFLGTWLVSEYVYNPDGSFAGVVRQRRELAQLPDRRIRVTQHCTPDQGLAGHPMGRFRDSWIFDLSIEGRFRRYHGPDVVGTGTAWADGVMTGEGIWPRFGHNFSSYSFLLTPQLQLTGGAFFNASALVASVAGVAVAETVEQSQDWPALPTAYWPGELRQEWRGTVRTLDAAGNLIAQHDLVRRYSDHAWIEEAPDGQQQPAVHLDRDQERWPMTLSAGPGQWSGLARHYGPMLELVGYTAAGLSVAWSETLDAARGHVAGLRRWLVDGRLDRLDIIQLRPASAEDNR